MEGDEFPKRVGGGWFELSDGTKVQGEEKAKAEEARLRKRGGNAMTSRGNKSDGNVAEPSAPMPGERELIFIATHEAALRAHPDEMTSLAGVDVTDLNDVLAAKGVVARPLFGSTEDRLTEEATAISAMSFVEVPDLSVFYKIEAPDEQLESLLEDLQQVSVVESAYIKPPAEPAVDGINLMAPAPEEAPPATPDFTARQGYLTAAPAGVDAVWAATRPGGRGAGVRVIDVEGAWRFTHEDLVNNQGGVVGGTQSTNIDWRNHGTAVIGEIGADLNTFGVTGIAPDANQMAISIFGGTGSAGAIRAAANRLQAGDIILIELHRPGPRHNFQSRADQAGYIAIEWWEDDFAAIRYAVSRSVLVVEAAGNGQENLDDVLYNTPGPGFPAAWSNPFNRANRDSGAIVVGAGAPPPGTHGRTHGPDRSRLGFSNFGSMVDAQGWGREVTTTGYGDLQGGANEDLWYTDTFSGTSSASPIVVGALASLQGMLRASGRAPLTPARARSCLRSTGSPQQDAPGRPRTERIGNRPDLPALWRCATGGKILIKEGKEIVKEFIREEFKDKESTKDLIKDIKERPKELKDIKERIKEIKEFKESVKELKEREIKEREIKIREIKSPKESVEGKLIELERRFDLDPSMVAGGGLEARLANLEETVSQLVHFITPDLRPDLGGGALMYEEDYQSQSLEEAGGRAKQAKDTKDLEKLQDQ